MPTQQPVKTPPVIIRERNGDKVTTNVEYPNKGSDNFPKEVQTPSK